MLKLYGGNAVPEPIQGVLCPAYPQATLQAADGTQSFSYGKQIFSSLNFNKGSNLTVRECISSERILYRYYINRYVYNIYIYSACVIYVYVHLYIYVYDMYIHILIWYIAFQGN